MTRPIVRTYSYRLYLAWVSPPAERAQPPEVSVEMVCGALPHVQSLIQRYDTFIRWLGPAETVSHTVEAQP